LQHKAKCKTKAEKYNLGDVLKMRSGSQNNNAAEVGTQFTIHFSKFTIKKNEIS